MTKTIATVQFTYRDLAGFLDMLRYDRAVVESWVNGDLPSNTYGAPDCGVTWRVTLSADRFTPDRWHSFGLILRDQHGRPVPS